MQYTQQLQQVATESQQLICWQRLDVTLLLLQQQQHGIVMH